MRIRAAVILTVAFIVAWVSTAAVAAVDPPRWVYAFTAAVSAWGTILGCERKYLTVLLHRPTHRDTTVPVSWFSNTHGGSHTLHR